MSRDKRVNELVEGCAEGRTTVVKDLCKECSSPSLMLHFRPCYILIFKFPYHNFRIWRSQKYGIMTSQRKHNLLKYGKIDNLIMFLVLKKYIYIYCIILDLMDL